MKGKHALCDLFIVIVAIHATISAASLTDNVIDRNHEILDILYTPLKGTRSECYPPLGCLEFTSEWYHITIRPINLLPLSRNSVITKFHLYTRNNQDRNQELEADNRTSVSKSDFKAQNPTFVIIHGFASSYDADWMLKTKRELLKYKDANVILVDWSKGALPVGLPLYPVAATNARLVGLETAYLIEYLRDVFSLELGNIHLIGHSLGAHIAGYIGERIKGLARITGLDPSQSFFEGMPRTVRLDRTDANFVDVIHTDGNTMLLLGFGISQPGGHVDFYPNGGSEQPGCSLAEIPLQLMTERQLEDQGSLVGCSHGRSALLLIESIAHLNSGKEETCRFNGYKCESNEEFLDGQCGSCGFDGSDCGEMGLNAIKMHRGSGEKKLFFTTSNAPPYCMYHYHVKVYLTENPSAKRKLEGRLKISLYGSLNTLRDIELYDRSILIEHGTTRPFLIRSEYNVGEIRKIDLYWAHTALSVNPGTTCVFGCNKAIYVANIEVARLSSSVSGTPEVDSVKLCSGRDVFIEIKTESTKMFDTSC